VAAGKGSTALSEGRGILSTMQLVQALTVLVVVIVSFSASALDEATDAAEVESSTAGLQAYR
jgi:hypothetical protein